MNRPSRSPLTLAVAYDQRLPAPEWRRLSTHLSRPFQDSPRRRRVTFHDQTRSRATRGCLSGSASCRTWCSAIGGCRLQQPLDRERPVLDGGVRDGSMSRDLVSGDMHGFSWHERRLLCHSARASSTLRHTPDLSVSHDPRSFHRVSISFTTQQDIIL